MGRKKSIVKELSDVYTYFIRKNKIYLANDRIYYQTTDNSWTYVDKESSIEEHTKNKQFLLVALLMGAQLKTNEKSDT